MYLKKSFFNIDCKLYIDYCETLRTLNFTLKL